MLPTSSVAKLNAPWGMDITNCAPAPLVSSLNDNFDSCDDVPRPCRSVFTTFAGCMHVCARLRLTAPANIASLNVRLTALAPPPPRDAFAAPSDPFSTELEPPAPEIVTELVRAESTRSESVRPLRLPAPKDSSCCPFLRSRVSLSS